MKITEEKVRKFVDELQKDVHQFVDYGIEYERTPWIAITDDEGKPYLQKKIMSLIQSIIEENKKKSACNHYWVWIKRNTFQCSSCWVYGTFEDGYIMEDK